jgi:hypothetical protein
MKTLILAFHLYLRISLMTEVDLLKSWKEIPTLSLPDFVSFGGHFEDVCLL